MSKHDKTKERVLSGASNANIHYDDLCGLLRALNFEEKQGKGSHLKFSRSDIFEILILQPRSDGKAKPYQVKQVAEIIRNYQL